MKVPSLSIDKVEFVHVKVEANPSFEGEYSLEFLQLDFPFKGVLFRRRMTLQYDKDKAEDPKDFIFGLNIILVNDEGTESPVELPYSVDIKAIVYLRYKSDTLHGMELFRAVRATGYVILYGAIREMVSNLTARGSHGIWSLPSANFNEAAQEEAEQDEVRRQAYILKKTKAGASKPKRPRKKLLDKEK